VTWIDQSTGGAEAEHPAPTLQLSAASTTSDDADSSDSDDTLAIVALVVGALGLVAGGAALVVARRSRPKPA